MTLPLFKGVTGMTLWGKEYDCRWRTISRGNDYI